MISHQLTSNLISALFNNVKNSSLQLSYDSSSILSRRSSLSQPFVSPSRSFIQSIIQPLKPRQSIKSIFKSLIPSPTFDPSRWKSSFYFVHPQIKDKSSFPSVKSIFKKLTGAESIQRPVALPAPNVFGVQPELYAQLPPNYQYANVQPEQQPEQLQQQQQQQYVQQVHPQQQYETQYTQQQNQQQKPYDQQQYQQQTEQQQFIQQFEQQIPLQQMQQVQYQYEQQQQQQPYQQQQYQVEQVQQVQQQQIQPQTVQQLGPHQPLYQIHPQVYQSNGNSIGNSNQMTQYGFKPIHSSSGAAKQAPKQQINTQGSNGPGISLSMGGSNDGYSSSKSAAPQSGFSISLGSGENAPGMTISLGSGNEANQASASNQQGYSTGGYSSGSYSGGYSSGPGVSISMGGGGGGSGMSVSLGSGGDSYGSGESGAGAMSFSLGGANNYDSGSGMQVQFGGEPNYQGQSYNYAPSSSNSYSQGTSSYGQEGSYGSNSYGSNSYGNNYNYNNVNKNIYKYYDDKPIMSIQMPAKGKTLIEANLKIPPIKMKINSSPRVKITAGTTDPLEKPHEDEETIMEDIFKPPKPFEKAPRKNTTSDEDGLNGNKTITDDGTHNGTITDDFHPQYLPYPPPYPSSYYQGYVPEGYYDGNPQEISLLTHQSYSNTNMNEIDHSKSYTKQTSHQQYGYDTNKASSSSSLPSIQTQTNQNQISQSTVNRKPQISFIPITHQPQAQLQPRPSPTHRYSDLQTSGSSQHDIYVKSNTKQRRQDNPVVQKKMQKVPQSSNNVPYYNSNSPVQYSQSYHNGQPVSNQQAQDDHPNNGKHYYGTQGTGAGYKYYNQGHYDMFNNQYQKQYEYQQQKARHYQNLYGYNVPNYNNQPYKPYQQPYYNKYYKKDPNYSPSGFHNGSLDYEQSKKFGKMFEQYGPGIKSNEKAQVILDIRPRISFKFHNKSEPMESIIKIHSSKQCSLLFLSMTQLQQLHMIMDMVMAMDMRKSQRQPPKNQQLLQLEEQLQVQLLHLTKMMKPQQQVMGMTMKMEMENRQLQLKHQMDQVLQKVLVQMMKMKTVMRMVIEKALHHQLAQRHLQLKVRKEIMKRREKMEKRMKIQMVKQKEMEKKSLKKKKKVHLQQLKNQKMKLKRNLRKAIRKMKMKKIKLLSQVKKKKRKNQNQETKKTMNRAKMKMIMQKLKERQKNVREMERRQGRDKIK